MKYLTYIGAISHSERSSDHLSQKVTGFTMISLLLEFPYRASKTHQCISFGHMEVLPGIRLQRSFP